MSFFTSRRERRLWLWALGIVAAIYFTLWPAVVLVEALRERNLLRLAFGLGLILPGAALAWRWVKQGPGWREIAVAVGVGLAYWWSWARLHTLEERTHLFEYGIVAALVYQALTERRRRGRSIPAPAVLAWVVTALVGWLDEGVQALVPNRVYDLRDVGFNAFAAFLAVASTLALRRARRRFGRAPEH